MLKPDDLARERMKQQETVPHHANKDAGEPSHPPAQQTDDVAGAADEK